MDLTANLSDEILIQIFRHLPSLRDKLRLESVSPRFQRCLFELINTSPIPFSTGFRELNGYNVSLRRLRGAIESLAKKAKFSSVVIDMNGVGILTDLANSGNDCLEYVTSVQIGIHTACSEILLKDALAKCPKLSHLRLDFHVIPINSDHHIDWCQSIWEVKKKHLIDLGVILKDKALDQLDLQLQGYTQQQLIQLYQSLKPNTLKKVHLSLCEISVGMDALMSELGGGAWAALEEIHIQCKVRDLQLNTFFHSLDRLPVIRKCYLMLPDFKLPHQLVAAIVSLFGKGREVTVEFSYLIGYPPETGCQFVQLIRKVQSMHPDLQVDFGPDGNELTLTRDNVSFKFVFTGLLRPWTRCGDVDCAQCGIFYVPLPSPLLGFES